MLVHSHRCNGVLLGSLIHQAAKPKCWQPRAVGNGRAPHIHSCLSACLATTSSTPRPPADGQVRVDLQQAYAHSEATLPARCVVQVWNSDTSEEARKGIQSDLVSDAPEMRLLYTTPGDDAGCL